MPTKTTLLLFLIILMLPHLSAQDNTLNLFPINTANKMVEGDILLVLNHRTTLWQAFRLEGDSLVQVDKNLEFDLNGEPILQLANKTTVYLAVRDTNPLLYELIRGKASEEDAPDLAKMKKLAGLLGGNLTALAGVLGVEELITASDNVANAVEAPSGLTVDKSSTFPKGDITSFANKLNELKATLKTEIDNISTANNAITAQLVLDENRAVFIQNLESSGGFDLSGTSPYTDTKAVDTAKNHFKDAKDAIDRKDAALKPTCSAIFVKAAGFLAHDWEDRKAALALYQQFVLAVEQKTADNCNSDWDDILPRLEANLGLLAFILQSLKTLQEEVDIIASVLESVEPGAAKKLRNRVVDNTNRIIEYRDYLSQLRSALMDSYGKAVLGFAEAKAGADNVSTAYNNLVKEKPKYIQAAARIQELAVGIDTYKYMSPRVLNHKCGQNFSAWLLDGTHLKAKWDKVRTGNVKIEKRPSYKDSVVTTRPASVNKTYKVKPKSRWGFGVAFTATDLEEKEWALFDNPDAVNGDDPSTPEEEKDIPFDEKVIGLAKEKDRAGQLAVMANYRYTKEDQFLGLGIELGANANKDETGIFAGHSFDLGRYIRLGIGYTWQKVNVLADRQVIASFSQNGDVEITDATTLVGAEYQIRLKERFESAAYFSLTLKFDKFPIFSAE